MGWAALLPLAGAAIGAISGRKDRKAQERANAANLQPRPYSETRTTTPGLGTQGPLEGSVREITDLYNRQNTRFNSGRRPPSYRGPSSSSYNFGPSELTGELVNELAGRAREGSKTVSAGQDYVRGSLGGKGPSNYMLEGAFNRSKDDPASGYFDQFIQGLMSSPEGKNPPFTSGATQRLNGSSSSGGASVSGRPGDYSNPELEEYMSSVLGGDFLKEGNPYSQAIIDRMTQLSGDERERAVADLTRREAGAGRFGRGRYGTERALVEDRINDALTGNIGSLLSSNYQFERGQMGDTANLMSGRDVSRWGDQTNRYGIDSSAATARGVTASNIAGQERMNSQNNLLSAITGYGGYDLSRTGMQGQLGQQYGAEALGALGMIPGLEDASYAGYDRAMPASFQADKLRNEAERARMSGDQARAQQAYNSQLRNFDYEENAEGGYLDDRIRRLLGIGIPFGTTNVSGMAPGGGGQAPLPGGAVQGGIGGLLAGLGALGQFGGNKPQEGNYQ